MFLRVGGVPCQTTATGEAPESVRRQERRESIGGILYCVPLSHKGTGESG